MLHTSTVEPAALDLLKELLAIPKFENLYLVGGTALSLKFGHRISEDLDLFSTEDFDKADFLDILLEHFPDMEYRRDQNPVGIFCRINNVKVDIVKHHYFKNIGQIETTENIRMFGNEDIIAMKIFAILKRAKKKDFFDLAELSKHFTMQQMLDFYKRKYPDHMLLISIPQAITYFVDAESDADPMSLNGMTWENVKVILSKKVNEFMK